MTIKLNNRFVNRRILIWKRITRLLKRKVNEMNLSIYLRKKWYVPGNAAYQVWLLSRILHASYLFSSVNETSILGIFHISLLSNELFDIFFLILFPSWDRILSHRFGIKGIIHILRPEVNMSRLTGDMCVKIHGFSSTCANEKCF